MKIKDIEYFRLDLPLASPYTIAYETVSKATNVILKINTSDGLTGWGCAAPDKEITRESADDVITATEHLIIPLLKGENPYAVARFNHLLKSRAPALRSTLAMLDIALHDLMARKARLPLYRLLGGFRHRIPTSITIGITGIDQTLKLAKDHWEKGFRIIKLKGGRNMEEDVEKIFKLRELLGKELALRFDANQGYSVAESVRFIELIRTAGVEILEQPTAYGDDKAMKQVTDKVPVPVMADESIRSLKDAFRLSSHEIMDMVNIKIMKVGGLSEAQHINSVAKAAGMEVMVGCLDESALGIAAGLHFALSKANVEYADLDGHLDLLNDPFTGLFRIEQGWIIPAESDGLGKIKL